MMAGDNITGVFVELILQGVQGTVVDNDGLVAGSARQVMPVLPIVNLIICLSILAQVF